jgi:hypothetical protein
MINGLDHTVCLSDEAKVEALAQEIVAVLRKKHVALKRFR